MMNKKIAVLAASALLFAACSGSTGSTSSDGKTTNTATVENGDSEVTAIVTKDADGKIVNIDIDEITAEGDSKKELGSDYNMKKASGIGKEWDEQIEFLEKYMVDNGIDSITVDDNGVATNEDVKSGATINIKPMIEAVQKAAEK